MGTQLPQKKGHSPTQFLAHVYCGQTAGWIKVPFGTEVNPGPGDVVLDGVVAPTKRGTAPSFRFMSIVAKGWIDEDATWYGSRLRRDYIVLDGNPAAPQKGDSSPPPFGPCLLWPWSSISATAELLLLLFVNNTKHTHSVLV